MGQHSGVAILASAPPFRLFGPAHLAGLGLTALAAALLSVWLRRNTGRPSGAAWQRVTCLALALVVVGSWLAQEILMIVQGEWSARKSLPLQLCDAALWLCFGVLLAQARRPRPTAPVRPDGWLQRAYELAWFWSMGGSSMAILTPDVATDFPSFFCIRFFLTHAGNVVSAVALTIGLGMRPQPGAVWRAFVAMVVLGLAVLVADWLLGANYMYLLAAPEQPTLYNYLLPWPWVLPQMAGLGLVVFAGLYAPFWRGHRRARR